MSGAPDYSINPFWGQPQPTANGGASPVDQARELARQVVDRTAQRQWDPHILTPAERHALANAPKKPGTMVTLEADPAPWPGADHMFVDYNDGHTNLIARGGPRTIPGLVMAGVTPAEQSKDYGKGQRVMFQGFVPDATADQAASYARRHADGVNQAVNLYGFNHNSNSYAADVIEQQFGRRVGDDRTIGYRNRLNDQPPQNTVYPGTGPMPMIY